MDEEDILHIVSKWTGIPLQRMEQDEMQRLLAVESEMAKVVIGQREAVAAHLQGPAPLAGRPQGPAAGPSARSRCSARPASARPCWPRPSPSRCSATPSRSSSST